MTNQTSMRDILTMTPCELMNLPVEELLVIQQEIADESNKLKTMKMIFEGVLEQRYLNKIGTAYQAKGDEYGKASFKDGDAVVEVNTPKKISWDEAEMAKAEQVIRNDWKGDPSEYMQITRKVSETAWKSWPQAIRDLFANARTEETGKRNITIKLTDKQEAA